MQSRTALHLFLLTLAAATTSTLGIMYAFLWWLAPVGLTLFFLALVRINHRLTAISAGFFYGFSTGGAGIIWFFDTLPLDWLFIFDPAVQVISLTMTWAYITLALGTAVAVGSIALWYLLRLPYHFLLVPFVWVLIEEGRGWMFSIFTYAPQSLLGGHFSAASIGYPLVESTYLLHLRIRLACTDFPSSPLCSLQ